MTTKPKATTCACGQPTYKGARCKACFNEAHRQQQNARRAKSENRCRCGRKIGAHAKVCRECNGIRLGISTTERLAQQRKVEVRPVRIAAQAWPGLRGPGGEWEKGPTTVQGWATLDGGRL